MSAIRSRIEWFAQLNTADAPSVNEETKFQRKVRSCLPLSVAAAISYLLPAHRPRSLPRLVRVLLRVCTLSVP